MKLPLFFALVIPAVIVVAMSWSGVADRIIRLSMSSELLAISATSEMRVRNMQEHLEAELNATVDVVSALSAAVPSLARESPFSSTPARATVVAEALGGAMLQQILKWNTSRARSGGNGLLAPPLMCRFADGAAVVARQASAANAHIAVIQVHQTGTGAVSSTKELASTRTVESFAAGAAQIHRRVVDAKSLKSLAVSSTATNFAATGSGCCPEGTKEPLAPSGSTKAGTALWAASANVTAAAQLAPPTPGGESTLLYSFRDSDPRSVFFTSSASSSSSSSKASAPGKLILPIVSHALSSLTGSGHFASCFSFLDVARDFSALLTKHLLQGEGSRAMIVDSHGRVLADTLGETFFVVDNRRAMDVLLDEEKKTDAELAARGAKRPPLYLPLTQRCFPADDDADRHACLHDVASFRRYEALRHIDPQLPLSHARDQAHATASGDASQQHSQFLRRADVVRHAEILGDGSSGEIATVDRDTHVFAVTLHRRDATNSNSNSSSSSSSSSGELRLYLFVPVNFFVAIIMSAVDTAIGVACTLFALSIVFLVLMIGVIVGTVGNLVDAMADPWQVGGSEQQRSLLGNSSSSSSGDSSGGGSGSKLSKGGSGSMLSGSGGSAPVASQEDSAEHQQEYHYAKPEMGANTSGKNTSGGASDLSSPLSTAGSDTSQSSAKTFFRRLSSSFSMVIKLQELHELEQQHDALTARIHQLRLFMDMRQARDVILRARAEEQAVAQAEVGVVALKPDASGGGAADGQIASLTLENSKVMVVPVVPEAAEADKKKKNKTDSGGSKRGVRFDEEMNKSDSGGGGRSGSGAGTQSSAAHHQQQQQAGVPQRPFRGVPSSRSSEAMHSFCCMSFQFGFVQEIAAALIRQEKQQMVLNGDDAGGGDLQQQQQQTENLQGLMTATTAVAKFCRTILDSPVTVIEFLGDGLLACVRIRGDKQSATGSSSSRRIKSRRVGGGDDNSDKPRKSKLMLRLLASIFDDAKKMRDAVAPVAAQLEARQKKQMSLAAATSTSTSTSSTTTTPLSITPSVHLGLCVGRLRVVDTSARLAAPAGGEDSSSHHLFRPCTFMGCSISSACAFSRLLASAASVSSSSLAATAASSLTPAAGGGSMTYVPLHRYHNVGVMKRDDASWITQRGQRTGCVVAINGRGLSMLRPDLESRPVGFADVGRQQQQQQARGSYRSRSSTLLHTNSSGRRDLVPVLAIYGEREAPAEAPSDSGEGGDALVGHEGESSESDW